MEEIPSCSRHQSPWPPSALSPVKCEHRGCWWPTALDNPNAAGLSHLCCTSTRDVTNAGVNIHVMNEGEDGLPAAMVVLGGSSCPCRPSAGRNAIRHLVHVSCHPEVVDWCVAGGHDAGGRLCSHLCLLRIVYFAFPPYPAPVPHPTPPPLALARVRCRPHPPRDSVP